MKKLYAAAACALLALFLMTVPCMAHSGRTDEQGGHYDKSTGEYHFHHGFPAHQHTNGVCPYAFEDRTDHGDGGSGSGGTREDPPEPEEAPEPEEEEAPEWRRYALAAVGVLVFFPLGWLLLELASMSGRGAKRKPLPKPERKGLPPPKKEADRPSPILVPEETRERYRVLLEGKSVWELSGVPGWAYFDAKDLPHARVCDGEEDPFLVHITKAGRCYHRPECHMARSGEIVNICEARQRGLCACSACRPMEQLPDFVEKYQRIKRIQRAFQIRMLP